MKFYAERIHQRGYITVLTMVLGAICAVLLMQMVSYSVSSRKQIIISRDYARYSSILDSILDYTAYGIQNRWCFDPLWLKDNTNCNLGNPRSSEGLLLNLQSLKSIKDYARETGTPLPAMADINKMGTVVRVSDIGNSHPLFRAINGLSTANKDAIYSIGIEVERMDSSDYPTRGNEAALRITATINSAGPATKLFGNFASVSSSSMILVTPRELNYFTLIIPKDLRLDGGSNGAVGDLNINPGTGGIGVVFDGPVFVNGDIHLPHDGFYTSATFVNKVYMGKGSIYKDGKPYSPATAGGPGDQYYSEMKTFGGFGRGIDIDGVQDEGLLYLAGLKAGGGPPEDMASMQLCRDVSNAEMDLALTKKSDLLVKPVGPVTLANTDLVLGLSARNRFSPQGYNGFRMSAMGTSPVATDPAVMDITITPSFIVPPPPPGAKTLSYSMGRKTVISGNGFGGGTTADFSTSEIVADGLLQGNLVGLNLKFGGNLNKLNSIKVDINAYDVSVFGGTSRRTSDTTDPDHSTSVSFTYPITAGALASNPIVGTAYPNSYVKFGSPVAADGLPPYYPEDQFASQSYEAFRSTCQIPLGPDDQKLSGSFKPGEWNSEGFLDVQTRNSWAFTDSLPPTALILPTDSDKFEVHSIAQSCTVKSTANFIAGFFNCDSFVIDPRTQPLTFIGTLITSKMTIPDSAVKAGVHFMNIYYPSAVYQLRAKKILRAFSGNCDTTPGAPSLKPVWHPEPSPQLLYDLQSCNVGSLREKADPFTWTTVSPECGTVGSETVPTCLRRPRHFLVREISRQSDLQ